MLNLRHQELELRHQNAELHDHIKNQQAKLWSQQLQISEFTAPNAINATVKGQKIDMVPRFSARNTSWIDPSPEPDKAHHGH
jgi:hypothetical protein